MKSVIISALIGFAVILGGMSYSRHIDTVSQKLLSGNREVTELIKSEEYDRALDKLENVSDYLEKKHVVLGSTGKHDKTDEMEMNIAELKMQIKNKSKNDALVTCATLDFLFEYMPKNIKLRIENIL